jgi:hypothetical protein
MRKLFRMVSDMETALISKYGISFIVFANLWELERAMTAAELAVAREIRMRSTSEICSR